MGGMKNEIKSIINDSQKKYETEIEVSLSTKPNMDKKSMMKKHKKGGM